MRKKKNIFHLKTNTDEHYALHVAREIISNYFIIQEFSNNKISLYQKVIYNKLIKLIEEKKKK